MLAPCSYCKLHWHLDCLDPPAAMFQGRVGINGKPLGEWMCPNHVDHELLGTDPCSRSYGRLATGNGTQRTMKIRRPRNPKIITPALSRGIVNNGRIEIENEMSDDDHDLFDHHEFGAIYRLPEKGIKLDFVDKMKR